MVVTSAKKKGGREEEKKGEEEKREIKNDLSLRIFRKEGWGKPRLFSYSIYLAKKGKGKRRDRVPGSRVSLFPPGGKRRNLGREKKEKEKRRRRIPSNFLYTFTIKGGKIRIHY